MRGKSVVHIIANIEGERRGTLAEYLEQAVGVGLFSWDVIHGDDLAKKVRCGPGVEGEGEFLASASGEQVQLEALGPALELGGSDEHFLATYISRAAVGVPVKLLKGIAGFRVGRGSAKGGSPVRHHAPIVVVSRLVFPSIELRPGDTLAGEKAHGVQGGTPETLADVDEDAIDVKDKDLRKRRKSFAGEEFGQGALE